MNLEQIDLKRGGHKSRDAGMCAMEFVAYLANEPHSDKPQCVSPLITSFIISCNDRWTHEERQLLKPYLPRVIGTRDGRDSLRAKIFAMHAVTRISPHAIELIGLKRHAEKMRSCTTLEDGILAAESAKSAAEYAKYAKYAKYAESAESAEYAAECAARSAAEFAAARSAARSAECAARSAEYAEDQATRKAIIQSCLEVLDEVLRVGA